MSAVDVERVGDGVVIRPRYDPEPRPFESLTEDHWDAAWEQPMRATIEALPRAHHDGVRRIVVVVPTTGMSGGSLYAHVAAPAEAVRVLVKSAARQWGALRSSPTSPSSDRPDSAPPSAGVTDTGGCSGRRDPT